MALCVPSAFDKSGRRPPMPVLDIAEIRGALEVGSPLAGVDVGEITLGVAVSDTRLIIASPLTVIRRRKFTLDAPALFALMDQRGAGGLVVGLPVNMDGTEGRKCQSVRAFVRHLLRLKDLPVAFWDERLSTAAVNRVLIDESDRSRARRAQLVDGLAAAWILQGALDRLSAHQPLV